MESTESVVSKRFFLFISLFATNLVPKDQTKKTVFVCLYVCVCVYVREYVILTYERILGIRRVGIVVTIWPHISVPIPKNRHHNHWSNVSALVLNAILPYCMMTT